MTLKSLTVNTKHLQLLALVSLVSGALILFRPSTLQVDRAILSLVIFWTGLLPALQAFRVYPHKGVIFPFKIFIGIFYAVFFGLSGFLDGVLRTNHYGYNPDRKVEFFGAVYVSEINIKAQVLSLVGIFLLFASWNITKPFFKKTLPRFFLPGQYSQNSLYVLVWGLIILHLIHLHVPAINSIPSIGQFLKPAGYVGLALILHMYYLGKLPIWQRYIYFFIVLPFWIYGLLFAGSLVLLLTPLVLGFGLWLGIYFFYKRGLPWRFIIIFGIIFFGIYSSKNLYVSWVNHPTASFETKVNFIANMLESGRPENTPSLKGLFRRSSLIYSFSYVVEKTPREIPFWGGYTFKPMLTSWLPRVFWQGKPKERLGYEFGTRYSLIRKTDLSMSYNLPWLTELYINFGTLGVILGMPLIGLILSVLETVFLKRGQGYVEAAIGSAIILPLCFQEQNFSVMMGSLVPLTISLWLYFTGGFFVLSRIFRSSGSNP